MFKAYLAYIRLQTAIWLPVIKKLTKSAEKRGHYNLSSAGYCFANACMEQHDKITTCQSFNDVKEIALNPSPRFNNMIEGCVRSFTKAMGK